MVNSRNDIIAVDGSPDHDDCNIRTGPVQLAPRNLPVGDPTIIGASLLVVSKSPTTVPDQLCEHSLTMLHNFASPVSPVVPSVPYSMSNTALFPPMYHEDDFSRVATTAECAPMGLSGYPARTKSCVRVASIPPHHRDPLYSFSNGAEQCSGPQCGPSSSLAPCIGNSRLVVPPLAPLPLPASARAITTPASATRTPRQPYPRASSRWGIARTLL